MEFIKKFRFGFDLWGFLLFVFIMIPNIFSVIVPVKNNFSSWESVTPQIDTVMSISQYIMIAALCMIINTDAKKIRFNSLIALMVIFSIMYWASWAICYCGIWNTPVIMALCVLPCAAFIFYIIDRKNYFALPFAVVFAVLHIARSMINFIF